MLEGSLNLVQNCVMHIHPEEVDTLQEHRLIVWPQLDRRERAAGL